MPTSSPEAVVSVQPCFVLLEFTLGFCFLGLASFCSFFLFSVAFWSEQSSRRDQTGCRQHEPRADPAGRAAPPQHRQAAKLLPGRQVRLPRARLRRRGRLVQGKLSEKCFKLCAAVHACCRSRVYYTYGGAVRCGATSPYLSAGRFFLLRSNTRHIGKRFPGTIQHQGGQHDRLQQ